MSVRKTVEDREWDKFLECDDGNTAVRTYLCPGSSIRPSGLTIEGKIQEVTIDSTSWTPLPASALTARNAICIQNISAVDIKINYDDTIATYTGVLIGSSGERYYDITEYIIIYAKASSGTPTVIVEELA